MKSFKDFGIKPILNHFTGDKIKMDRLLNKEIIVEKFRIENSTKKENTKCLYLQIQLNGTQHVVFSGSAVLMEMIQRVPDSEFPFKTIIVRENEHFEFS